MRPTPDKDFDTPDAAYHGVQRPVESITLEETGEVLTQPVDDGHTVVSRTKAKAREPETDERYEKRGKAKRRDVQKALALRASGHTIGEIAEEIGAAPSTITRWFTEYRRKESHEQIDEMLDKTALPLAAENLVHGLLAGDKDYTLETLKGRGRLKHHAAVKTEGSPTVVPLVIQINGAPSPAALPLGATPKALPTVAVGAIVGAPALPIKDGVIVEEK